jgi:hypothetical protein
LPLQSGLPHAPAHWLTVQEHFGDLVVATYGRGFWILDDISPLRDLTPALMNESAHLFAPRPAYRFRPITEPMMMPDDATEGRNPPDGVPINFLLKSVPPDAPKDAVKIVISDAEGKQVRKLEVGKEASAGFNRVWWDLRYDPTPEFKLRTAPLYAVEFKAGPEGTRKFPTGGPLSILVPPGTYTVKLIAGGRELTQPVTVRKDPNTAGTEADVQAQTKLLMEIRANVSLTTELINQSESVRAQLETLQTILPDDDTGKAVRTSAEQLSKKIAEVEGRLFNMTSTGRGQDMLRLPSQMLEKLLHLADVASLADFPPTDQEREVHAKLSKELTAYHSQLRQMATTDVPAFNAMLKEKGISGGVILHGGQ